MKHTHKYQRTKLGSKGYIVYKCMLPSCPHFINESLLLGRECICWRCGDEFIITKHYKKPHCNSCTRPRKVDELGNELLKHFAGILEGKL